MKTTYASNYFKILKQENNQNKLLQMVYKDPSTMINEITPENFDLFIRIFGILLFIGYLIINSTA